MPERPTENAAIDAPVGSPTPFPAMPGEGTTSRRSLVDDLQAALAHAAGGPMRLGDAVALLRERGPAMVLLLLALPCLLPGVASVMAYVTGPAVTLFGLQVACRLSPGLPRRLADRELSPATLKKLSAFAARWGPRVERLLRPRLDFMGWAAVDVAVGLSLAFLGIFLFVPWLVPLSNELPAMVIVVLLLGMIERDGVFLLLGEGLTLVIVALCGYVGYLFWKHGLHAGLEMLHHRPHVATRP